jgi:ferric-dicitrate binding protein FerR (iron transport regulator)
MKKEENEAILLKIARYFGGSSSEEENISLRKWIQESDENKKCFEQLLNIWLTKDPSFFNKSIYTDRALEKILQKITKKPVLKNIWTYWGKIAAVIFIPMLIVTFLWVSAKHKELMTLSAPVYNEVFATFGTRTSLRLADGTLVWLNSGSSLKYPDKFTGEKREVFLRGEAYFEVTTNPRMPFIVKSRNLNVKATGTRFNVLDYSSDIKSEVTLVSGKVFVSEFDTTGSGKLISELNPDQHMVYNDQTKSFKIDNEETYKYYSWKDGKLIFRNEPLSEVVKKIGQVFNVDIELRGAKLQGYRYRATFEDESLSEILKLLEISSPIKYKEIKRMPLPDGTFPKKKVIIFPAGQNI